MPQDEDRRLVALYDAHAPSVWRYVVHLTGDPAGADDIVQETLLRAWRSRRIMEQEPESTRSWMFTVARNLVIDTKRSARNVHEIVTDTLPEEKSTDATDAILESWIVADALTSLSMEHRAVIVHAYFAGRTVAETAAQLQIPEGTVKSRLHYGMRALRLALQEKGVTR